MRPNNRQRSRGRNGGGGNHNQHKQHNHNPNRPPNRNQIFDSSGPDVRVRGNAHQVYDKYQALAREAAAMGDRIQAEAYWQYADHYFRVIQSQGGFVPRTNQWGEGGEEGQQQQNPQQQDGQPNQPHANGANGANGAPGGEGYVPNERQHDGRNEGRNEGRQHENRQHDGRQSEGRQHEGRQNDDRGEAEPGLGGVAFLQSGRSAAASQDPAMDDQPEVPEFRPAGRRG